MPLPIASIARNLGLTRQAVRAVANDLAAAGLVNFAPNPHHRTARLVVRTPEGEIAHKAAAEALAALLARGIGKERIEDASRVIQSVLKRLDDSALEGRDTHE